MGLRPHLTSKKGYSCTKERLQNSNTVASSFNYYVILYYRLPFSYIVLLKKISKMLQVKMIVLCFCFAYI